MDKFASARVIVAVSAVVVAVAFAATTTTTTTTTSGPDLDLTPVNVSRACTTDAGRVGICVKYSQCRDNGTIDKFGTIDENEIRAGNCPGRYDWCCEEEGNAKSLPQADCLIAKEQDTNVCPWCVTLHRDGGAPYNRGPKGRSCAGVLVGDGGAVLTATSCIKAAQKQHLWLQHNENNYTVHTANMHPLYNSGSREHDMALVVLSGRVEGLQGACLSFNPPSGRCRAISFGKEENTWSVTEIEVSDGRCGERGGMKGAACGKTNDPNCAVSLGSPLLCQAQSGDSWSVWGVSRGGGCGFDEDAGTMYSTLAADKEWLEPLLPNQKVSSRNPTEGPNDPNDPFAKYGVIENDEIRKTP